MHLIKGARNAVLNCVGVKKGEKVLILTDRNMPKEISLALDKACKEVKAHSEIKIIKPLKRDGQEPPKEIANIMRKYDVLFLVTSKSLTHTDATRLSVKNGARVASMPHVELISFTEGGLTADYSKVKKLSQKMLKKIKKSKNLKIRSDNGTDVSMEIGRYKIGMDEGDLRKRSCYGNLPAGEVFTSPNDFTTNGVIVFDHMGKYGKNIEITVKDGYAEKIKSKKLLEEVNKLGKKARFIAEIGIGTNPKSKVIGNVLEDEKVFGTVHIALGNNVGFGGKNNVEFHVDGIILKPTLIADNKVLIKNGKWML